MYGGKIGLPELSVLLFLVFFVVAWVKIVLKTGHSGWMVLLVFIPLVNFVFLVYLAFSTWPIEKELQRLSKANSSAPLRTNVPHSQ